MDKNSVQYFTQNIVPIIIIMIVNQLISFEVYLRNINLLETIYNDYTKMVSNVVIV